MICLHSGCQHINLLQNMGDVPDCVLTAAVALVSVVMELSISGRQKAGNWVLEKTQMHTVGKK